MKEWGEKWFSAQVQLKPTTRSGYRHSLDKHVLPRWGQTRLGAVAHGDVQEWVNNLSVNLAPSTVRQIHLVRSGIMKFAIADRRISTNLSDDLRLPRIGKKSRGHLSHN